MSYFARLHPGQRGDVHPIVVDELQRQAKRINTNVPRNSAISSALSVGFEFIPSPVRKTALCTAQ